MDTTFKVFEKETIPLERLFNFLKQNYNGTVSLKIIHSLNYLEWFFSEGGVLGVLESEEEWVSIFCVGSFIIRYGNNQGAVFNSGPLCVNKKYLFKNLAQEVVAETSVFIKNKYNLPILGAGVGGVRKKTIFKNFGMFTATALKKPPNKCFSSNNLFLCDNSSFLKKFKNEDGMVMHYPQKVNYNGKDEKWGIISSYFAAECWKNLIYNFSLEEGKNYDRFLIFENSERKAFDLNELGFDYLTSYNLYVDTPFSLPQYFLYYNLFLY